MIQQTFLGECEWRERVMWLLGWKFSGCGLFRTLRAEYSILVGGFGIVTNEMYRAFKLYG
jgi:hypothetical protein